MVSKTEPDLNALTRTAICILLCLGLVACSRSSDTPYQGYVEGDWIYLSAGQSGQIANLQVGRGEQVAANTELFSLRSTVEQVAVDGAMQMWLAAKARLADLVSGKRSLELDVLKARILQAKLDARRAAAQWRRDQQQVGLGAVAQQQADNAKVAALIAAAHVQELERQLVLDSLAPRAHRLEEQEALVAAAYASFVQAQQMLDERSVRTPVAGTVDDTLYRLGEWVPAGRPVIKLLPVAGIKVRFFVPRKALDSLRPGAIVHVVVGEGVPRLNAKVTFISSKAEYTPPVVFNNNSDDRLVYMVEARPSTIKADALRPGVPVEVSVR